MQNLLTERNFRTRVEALGRDRVSPAHRAMYLWGILNCTLVWIQQIFNWALNPIGAQKYIYASMVAWLLVALWTSRIVVRIPLAIGVILVMQVWFTVCSMHAASTIARTSVLNGMDILLPVYVLCFLQAQALVWMAPESRRFIGRLVIPVCVISGIVALAQFKGVGPAIQYSNLVRQAEIVFDFSGTGEIVRAPGLHANIGTAISFGTMCMLMMSVVLFFRPFKWWEMGSIGILLLSTLLVQVRNQLLVIGLTVLWVGYLITKKYKFGGITFSTATLGLLGVYLVQNRDAFGYLFQGGTGTLDYRRLALWPQAYNILDQRPIFGIGIEPGFAGWTTQLLPNKWVTERLMDNGWLLAAAFGGYPGLGLMVLTVLTAFIAATIHALKPSEDVWHLAFKFAVLSSVIFFATGMFWGTLWANPINTSFYFIIAGLAMPSDSRLFPAKFVPHFRRHDED